MDEIHKTADIVYVNHRGFSCMGRQVTIHWGTADGIIIKMEGNVSNEE